MRKLKAVLPILLIAIGGIFYMKGKKNIMTPSNINVFSRHLRIDLTWDEKGPDYSYESQPAWEREDTLLTNRANTITG